MGECFFLQDTEYSIGERERETVFRSVVCSTRVMEFAKEGEEHDYSKGDSTNRDGIIQGMNHMMEKSTISE